MSSENFGVVVIGVGIAGRVRIRDILEQAKLSEFKELANVKYIGHISRRELEIEGSTQLTLEEALKRSDVHIIVCCTENERHEEIARFVEDVYFAKFEIREKDTKIKRSLEAGKHVLLEFPLALTVDKAKELLALAKENGLVCYTEDISLLTDQHAYVKELVKEKPKLVEGKTWLAGRFNGWIEVIEKSGSAFHSSIPQIHRLIEVFGDVIPVQAKIIKSDRTLDSYATVKTPVGGNIEIEIKREILDKPKRDTGFKFTFSDGSEIDSKNLSVPVHGSDPKKPGLFLKDFIQFMGIVNGNIDRCEQEKTIVRGMEVADELYQLAQSNPESKL